MAYSVILLDKEGWILSWNLGAERLRGYTEAEMLGKHISLLHTPEEVAAGVPQHELDRALNQGRFECESWKTSKNGERYWVNTITTALYTDEGDHVGFSKIQRDFTTRKHYEEGLEKSLKDLSDIKFALDESAILAITDAKGLITYVNQAFCKISQYTESELLGQNHRIINSGLHPKAFFQELWETIMSGKVWKGEIRNRAKDGSFYWVDTTIVPFMGSDQRPYQYVSIRKDVTSRVRVESEIRKLSAELEQRVLKRTADLAAANEKLSQTLVQLQESEKLRSTFISALTHDLRTPLIAQKRAMELLGREKDRLDQRTETLLVRLQESNNDLLEMVNMLLETYQYESGKISLVLEAVDLRQLVASCYQDLAAIAESQEIQLVNHLPEALPLIQADSHYLKRVFINLIGNALENIPPGCAISISSELKHDAIYVKVQDNGPGIPSDLLPSVFERYFIGHRTQKKIGTGLGLFICKMIMSLHQGHIDVSSQPEEGTCFLLTFPLSYSMTEVLS